MSSSRSSRQGLLLPEGAVTAAVATVSAAWWEIARNEHATPAQPRGSAAAGRNGARDRTHGTASASTNGRSPACGKIDRRPA